MRGLIIDRLNLYLYANKGLTHIKSLVLKMHRWVKLDPRGSEPNLLAACFLDVAILLRWERYFASPFHYFFRERALETNNRF